jgi:hypothetical protein
LTHAGAGVETFVVAVHASNWSTACVRVSAANAWMSSTLAAKLVRFQEVTRFIETHRVGGRGDARRYNRSAQDDRKQPHS